MTVTEVHSRKDDFDSIHMKSGACTEWLAFATPLKETGYISMEKVVMDEKLDWGLASRFYRNL
jgi:hypothetical protein